MFRKASRFIWIAVTALLLCGMLEMFIMQARDLAERPAREQTVSAIQTTNAEVAKFITATVMARTQNPGQ